MTAWQEFQQAGWVLALFAVPALLAALTFNGLSWGTSWGTRLAGLMGATLLLFVCAGAFGLSWAYLLAGALNLGMWTLEGALRYPVRASARPWSAVVFALPLIPAAYIGAQAMVLTIVWISFILAPWVAACHRQEDGPTDPNHMLSDQGRQNLADEAAEREAQRELRAAQRPVAAANRKALWDSVPARASESYQSRRKRVLAQRRRDIELAERAGGTAPPLY